MSKLNLPSSAILRGLFHSNAISSDDVRAVGAALKDAAVAALDRREPEAAKALIDLARRIRNDTAVS